MLVPTATYRAAAFVRAARTLQLDVTIATDHPSSLATLLPNDLITLDFADPESCTAAAEAFAKSHPVDAVVGIDDQVTVAAAAIGARLSLTHNPVDAARAARNKHTMRTRLAAAGVSVPRFRAVAIAENPSRVARETSYPCVLKPLTMAASRGVIRADTPAEFVHAFDQVSEILRTADVPGDVEGREYLLVEEYVPGWEVAVEGILTSGRLRVFAIFDKPDPLVGPYFPETIYVTPSRLPGAVRERIEATTQAATRALGLRHGPIHAELRGEGDRLWFIEVAARSIGGYCSKVLRFSGALSLEDVILRHALAPDALLPEREDTAAGVMMLQAPRAGRFVETKGLDEAARLPGIEEIIVSSHAGERVTPLPEGFLYLGFIFARGTSAGAVESALRAAAQRLDFVIEPA
jgi:biotin carboxylase